MLQLQVLEQVAFNWFLKLANFMVIGSIVLTGTLVFNRFASNRSASLKFMVVLFGLCSIAVLPLIPRIDGIMQIQPFIEIDNVTEEHSDYELEETMFDLGIPDAQIQLKDKGNHQKTSLYV